LAALDAIFRNHGVPRGWPATLAHAYLTRHLSFDVGPRELEAIRTFHRFAADEALIPPPRPLTLA
jgi:hypothetical protein